MRGGGEACDGIEAGDATAGDVRVHSGERADAGDIRKRAVERLHRVCEL